MKYRRYVGSMLNDSRIDLLENNMFRINESIIRMEKSIHSLAEDTKEGFKELRLEIKEVRSEMKDGYKKLETEMKDGYKKLETEMKEGYQKLETEMKEGDVKLESDIKNMNNRFWTNFLWILGILLSSIAGILTLIARSFHWL